MAAAIISSGSSASLSGTHILLSAHHGNDDDGRTAVCPRERFVTRQCRTSNVEHLSDTPMATRSYLHGLDMHINAYGDIRPHPEVVGTAPEVVRK